MFIQESLKGYIQAEDKLAGGRIYAEVHTWGRECTGELADFRVYTRISGNRKEVSGTDIGSKCTDFFVFKPFLYWEIIA